MPPKLAARVRLLDTGQINNNDENDARSVALAALRARVVPELVAEDQTMMMMMMMMRAWAHPMIVDRRPGVYSIPAPGRSLPNGSTREPSGHRATREFIARDIPMSGDDTPTWSGDYAPACSRRLTMRVFHPVVTAYAHCDLPCGVYDPAQARIEAESVKAIMEKYQGNEDPVFRTRALFIKEQRAELVKHHLWVLWTDYFKPPHFEKYPNLHDLFNRATKAAGATGGKGTVDPAEGQKLLDLIAEIDTIFWETKKA